MKSNKQIEEELSSEDPEWHKYVEENESIIMRTKDEILRILNAFLAAGIDIDRENVLSGMQHRALYMPPDHLASNLVPIERPSLDESQQQEIV